MPVPMAIKELMAEQVLIENGKKMVILDKELHHAYSIKDDYIEITSLHSFPQVMLRKNAILALELNRNRLLAVETCSEIVEDILDLMLEGWEFGERVSRHRTMGYVPSIDPTTVLSTLNSEKILKKNREKVEEQEKLKSERSDLRQRGSNVERWGA